MAQRSPPRRPRALIVEDEIMVALDLEETMIDLGFDSCGLAPSDRSARSLAMTDQPDVVLMDVCLRCSAVAADRALGSITLMCSSIPIAERPDARLAAFTGTHGFLSQGTWAPCYRLLACSRSLKEKLQ
jgi:DNA-binding NarL/FixJ family response regulator